MTEALDREYIVEPRLTIGLTEYRPFFILGQVNEPGKYAYIEGMTVRMAVALAGGLTGRADDDDVTIIRANDPNEERIEAGLDTMVLPGDTIEIGRQAFWLLFWLF